MLQPRECFRVRGEVIALDALHDEIIYALRHKTIKTFDTHRCQFTHTFVTEYLNSSTVAIAFHKTLQLVAIANEKTITIFDLKTQIVLQTILCNSGEITTLHFVQNSPYLIAGTNQGRVLQYRYDGKTSLSRLCSFPYNNPLNKQIVTNNYVSAIDSFDDLVASSGYGGAVTIIKLHSHTQKMTLQHTEVRIDTLKFISKDLLIAATAKRDLIFYNLEKEDDVRIINSPIGVVKRILPIEQTHYAVIAGDGNRLALLDTQNKKISSANFIHFDSDVVLATLLHTHTIVVYLADNTIHKVPLPSSSRLKHLIYEKHYDEAFSLLQDNPILQDTQEYQELEERYEALYAKALKAFIAGNKKEAHAVIAKFEKIPQKQKDVANLLKAFDVYPRFHLAFIDKKYTLAYSLCEKYPTLKHTYQYMRMEKEFKEAYTFAQRQILKGCMDVARDIIHPFINVRSKKEPVELLLAKNSDFLNFLKAVQAKEYPTIEKLLKKYPLFKELPNYLDLIDTLHEQLNQIQQNIYSCEIEKAMETIKNLNNVILIKKDLKQLYNIAIHAQELLNTYEKGDFLRTYEILDTHALWGKIQLSEFLEKHWQKRIDKAERSALLGDLKGVKESLAELLTLKTRSAKTGDLIRLSFHTKIRQLLAKRSFENAEKLLYRYLDIFGIDAEIRSLMNTFEKLSKIKLALILDLDLFKPRDSWLRSDFVTQER